MKKVITVCIVVLLGSGYAEAAGTWTQLDYPGVGVDTLTLAVSGNIVAGEYSDNYGGGNRFIYNTTTKVWTTVNAPSTIFGIDGSNIVGEYPISGGYNSRGYLYNITNQNWTFLDMPGAISTTIRGINGNNLVGYYTDNSGRTHGLLYDMSTQNWTTIDKPGASTTEILGLDGSNLVGSYDSHGFIYSMTTNNWTTLDMPGEQSTQIYGISGSNLVGITYSDGSWYSSNFLYDGQNWTILAASGATEIYPMGISGNNVVGYFLGADFYHGFIYTIPEPATLLLLGLGGLILRKKRSQGSL
jgi:hypothetical protein